MTCAYILKRPEFANVGEQFEWEIAHGQVPYELPITLPEAAWAALPDAISELSYKVQAAQSMFDHLSEIMSQGLSSNPGMIPIVELVGRGLKHVSEHECALLDDVEPVLRSAVNQMMQDKAAREAERKSA